MQKIRMSQKQILKTLGAVTLSAVISILGYACSPVKFSQGSKNDASTFGGGTPGPAGANGNDGTNGTNGTNGTPGMSGGGDPFVLIDPNTHEKFTFTSIDNAYDQNEFDPTGNDDDTLNFNFKNFSYNGNGACSVSQIKYEFDPTVSDPASFVDLYPPVPTKLNLDQSKAACKAAEISTKIKTLAGGSCIPTTATLATNELSKLKTIKMTTSKSGGDTAYILLEATFLQSPYANIQPPTINLDADCRCYYTFQYLDENYVNIMGLQEHCAAHFSNWNYQ